MDSFDYRHAVLDAQVLSRLQAALDYWQSLGLSYAALPWMVPQTIMDHPKPAWIVGPDPSTMEGPLVASGEQSFLWLSEQGFLAPSEKGYIGWSPCFRRESYDVFHHHYFIKAEVFIPVTDDHEDEVLEWVIDHTRKFLIHLSDDLTLPIERRQLPDQIDLELDNVELGSYGIRLCPNGQKYVFGTALAEPRWSRALASYRADQEGKPLHPLAFGDGPANPSV